MSTKTTLKRIALVAVSALGFGMFTAVAPASAAQGSPTSVVVGTIPQVRVGSTAYIPFKVYLPAGFGTSDTVVINAEAVAAPVATSNNAASVFLSGTDNDNNEGQYLFITDVAGTAKGTDDAKSANTTGENTGRVATNGSRTGGVDASSATGAVVATTGAGTGTGSYNPTTTEEAQGYVELYAAVTPDVIGTYTIMLSASKRPTAAALAQEMYAAGDVSTTATFTTTVAPTGVTLTTIGGGNIHAGATNGVAVLVTTTGGIPAGLESIDLEVSGATGSQVAVGASASSVTPGTFATTASLPASSFINGKALAWVRTNGTTAGTLQLVAKGGGALPASVTATKTFTVNVATGSTTAMTYEAPSATATYAMADAVASSNDINVTALSTSQSIGFTFTAYGATRYGYVKVTDDLGLLTGYAGLVYDRAYSVGSTAEGLTLSFAAASPASGLTLFTVETPVAAATTLGVATSVNTKTFKTVARGATAGSFTFSPASNILAAPGTAIAITATVKDQFGAAWAGKAVTITTSGRNNPVASTLVTDSAGKITFTTADTSTSTTQLIDTVTFSTTAADVTSSAVTINYGNTAVGTITVTGGNTTASVTALTTSNNPISVGSSTAGTEAGAITITATVRDASANALAGVPVTFSVAGDGVAFTSTSATKYTGSTGTAAGSLYAWKAGTYTYTVTAGGKSTTGTATFASTTAGNTRVVSATVNGNVVTGKAVDRFGNPVIGATLYAVTTAPANIGGEFVKTGTTNANGEIAWVVSGGGSVTVTAVNPTLPAGSTAYETCQLAGNRTCATASTAAAAYSATVAGTATTAETFVGATFAPAGVASATVTVVATDAAADAANAASDAAAEAIDAANAATDAANLAAEAADAATVAAEEARDAADAATAAVEELATQVATLMAALKAQITTLANTVAKIAKKVKA